jgi:chemotaxis signal transduction protein
MTDRAEQPLETVAAKLRATFDASFAAQQAPGASAEVDALAIRVSGHGYTLRLSEVRAVYADRRLTAVPSPQPALLGLVGVRGLVVPIYDLRLLLGYGAGPAPRWLALARAASPIGFAFEAFEAHWRLPLSAVVAGLAGEGQSHRFAPGSVKTDAGPRPLLHLPSLIESVTKHAPPSREHAREEPR